MRSALILLSLLPTLCLAHNLKQLEPLPTVSIADKGELMLHDKTFNYQNWSSSQLTGKVRLIQHIAGRSKAKAMNAPLIEAIKAAKFDHNRYQTTTIVDLDDTLFGTSAFVLSSVKESKEQFPWSSFVLDSEGRVRQSWGLQEESSAIVLLDRSGKVLFSKEGALTKEEINQLLSTIQAQL